MTARCRGHFSSRSSRSCVVGALGRGCADGSRGDAIELGLLKCEPDRCGGGGDRAPDVGQILIDPCQHSERFRVKYVIECDVEPGDIEPADEDAGEIGVGPAELGYADALEPGRYLLVGRKIEVRGVDGDDEAG